MLTRVIALSSAALLAFAIAGQALAFDCLPVNKKPGAGSVGTFNFITEEFTPAKNNPGDDNHSHGGFITFTDGELTADTFVHAPDGALPPVREGGPQHNCDGKGLDAADVCFGE